MVSHQQPAWPRTPQGWAQFDEWESKQLMGPTGLLPAIRASTSPVGPKDLTCLPCDHLWSDHDDNGCRWTLCRCSLPGERK